MANSYARRRETLLEEEHQLHDRLAEITRRLTNARATMQFYEDQLQATLAELNRISGQLAELNQSTESAWRGTGIRSAPGNQLQS
jgi:flagellar hook-associated protein FlgK